jgi:myosin heavy subunit
MSKDRKTTTRFSQKVNATQIKSLRRSSSFVKNLPRQSLAGASNLPLPPSGPAGPGQNEVWIEDDDEKWILCQKLRQENTVILLKNLKTNKVLSLDTAFKEVFPHDPNVTSDMITLRGLSEPSILYNLRERSLSKNPYTFMGTILISVNPFAWYDSPGIEQYKGRLLDPSNPHPYAIAGKLYGSHLLLSLTPK